MIPKIKFDALITIEDWSDALRTILDAAVAATQKKDSQERLGLQDLLLTFVKKSPAKVELLDVIAREAIEDLAMAEISVSLERISSRSAELSRAAGLVEAVTAEAKKDARELQLESTLEALNKIEKAVASPDLNLLEKLAKSGDAIAAAAKAIGPQSSRSVSRRGPTGDGAAVLFPKAVMDAHAALRCAFAHHNLTIHGVTRSRPNLAVSIHSRDRSQQCLMNSGCGPVPRSRFVLRIC